MARRCLVVDLRVSGVSLGVASTDDSEEDLCALLTDGAGRVRLPLASPVLWSEVQDEEDKLPVKDRVRLVAALLAREERGELPTSLGSDEEAAITSLIGGLKQYVESRLERAVQELAMLLPVGSSDAFRSRVILSGRRVGFNITSIFKRTSAAMCAYKIDRLYTKDGVLGHVVVVDVDAEIVTLALVEVEEGIFEILGSEHEGRDTLDEGEAVGTTLVSLLERCGISNDQVNHVILLGELTDFQADDMATAMKDRLPQATVHRTILASTVAVEGGVAMMKQRMTPDPASTLICCLQPVPLAISVETVGGLMAPVVRRHTLLPCTKTIRLSVFCPEQATPSAELRVFEGERIFTRDNTLLGSLIVEGLGVGWNEIDVRVDVTYELEITIDGRRVDHTGPVGEGVRLEVVSIVRGMSGDQYVAYINGIETNPNRVEEETARDQLHARLCTEEIIRSACTLLRLPTPLAIHHPGHVLPATNFAMGPSTADLEAQTVELLNGINWYDERGRDSETVHDALLELLGGQIVWKPYGPPRCPGCRSYEERRP